MFQITDRHIDFILDDLGKKGIRIGDLRDNLLDHVCILIEQNLEEGDDFESYYHSVIQSFYKERLYEIEEETLFLLRRRKCFAVLSRIQFFLLLFILLIGPIIIWTIADLGGRAQKNDIPTIVNAWEGAFVFALFPLITLLVLFLTPKRFDPLIPREARILLGWRPFIEIKPFACRNVFSILVLFLYFLMDSAAVHGQTGRNVFISDVDNFWMAFDSVQAVHERDKQINLMQSLYIDRGTHGLKEFMNLRNFDAAKLVESINKYPRFWKSIRPNTLKIGQNESLIESYIKKFKTLYPDIRAANIYFTITAIRAAGSTQDSLVLIGSEIALGDKNTDVSEFPDKRLANFFNSKNSGNIIPVVIHEYVHTQQKPEGKMLLAEAIYEGTCDFITELILERPLGNSYLIYGRKNEKELKRQFKKEMYSEDLSNWLYNGSTSKTMGDLGYFMGYSICKSFYRHSKDKTAAIKAIINLNYLDQSAVTMFLTESKYY